MAVRDGSQAVRTLERADETADPEVDAHLFAITLRNLRSTVEWARNACNGERDGTRGSSLGRAFDVFDGEVPRAREVRDVQEHFIAYESVDVTIPVNVHATVRVGAEEGTLGAGHYVVDSTRPLPQPSAPPSPSSNGSHTLMWLIGALVLSVLVASIVVQLLRRRRSGAHADGAASAE